MKSVKETYTGPANVVVEVDSDNISKGTSVLVLFKGGAAPIEKALGEYAVEGRRLTPNQMEWLYKIEIDAGKLLKPFHKK